MSRSEHGRRFCPLVKALWLFAALAFAAPAWTTARAAETMPGPVGARVVGVIDGDTLDTRAQIWLDQEIAVRVRLLGVDTPEMRGKCADEVAKARQAKARAIELLVPLGLTVVKLRDIKHDKYAGRVDARVELPDGRDLAGELIAAGLARAYAGGARRGWCP